MTSYLKKISAASYRWSVKKADTGYRISIHKAGFTNYHSAGTKDEIGYIHVIPSPTKDFFEVLNVEVLPDFQRQGLGSEMYYRARDEVKKQGGKGLISFSSERTPEASKLWKSLEGAKAKDGVWILT